MRTFRFLFFLIATVSAAVVVAPAQTVTAPAATPVATGKNPIIIIPGLTGSDLVNSKNGETVWFKVRRSKDDDLRLPISPILSRNRDGLVPKDILRSVKFLKFLPETEIYERLINAMETRGGYHEAKWNTTNKADAADTFYVFPYDWRRDNVENARLLINRIEALKRRLKLPNLKFNVVAHSMGGIIARYAAMYGDHELPVGTNVRPTLGGCSRSQTDISARHTKRGFHLGDRCLYKWIFLYRRRAQPSVHPGHQQVRRVHHSVDVSVAAARRHTGRLRR